MAPQRTVTQRSVGTRRLKAIRHGAGRTIRRFHITSDNRASLTELACASDLIVTMLPTSAVVEEVLIGDDGMLKGMRNSAIIVEMSPGSPTVTWRLAEAVACRSGQLVDAPVSDGVPRARDGTLAIMAGGVSEAIDRINPVLRTMGSSVTRNGPVGSAHAIKALNNLASAAGF